MTRRSYLSPSARLVQERSPIHSAVIRLSQLGANHHIARSLQRTLPVAAEAQHGLRIEHLPRCGHDKSANRLAELPVRFA
jgi:hypothetical protein